MAKLKLLLFGSFNPFLDDEVLQGFKTDKARALLAYLAVESGRPHRRAYLCSLLWPEANEIQARQNLSQALYNLRQLLGDRDSKSVPYLQVQEAAIQFNLSSDHWVDTNEFLQLVSAVEIHPHIQISDCTDCIQRLTRAVQLYQGDFLSGFSLKGCLDFNDWVQLKAERFQQMVMHALYRLSEGLADKGEFDQALGYAWRLVEMDMLWEQAQRLLIRLLAHSGRREAALAQYLFCQQVLREELGVEPELETRVLYESLRDHDRQDLRSLHVRQNLPASLTSFVGRDAEMASLKRLLADPDTRLVTVSGPGGSGKTRLATEAARSFAKRFHEGAYIVRLDLIDSAQFISTAIAEALALPLLRQVDTTDQIKDYLRDREILLLLDNFEHLSDGSNLVAELVKDAPKLKILVTSRFKLGVRGEQNYSLSGLDYPKPGSDLAHASQSGAVQFFIEANRRTVPGFELTEENYKSVIRICELAAGMPLALLLSAGWSGTFSTQEIAEEMESSLDFLTSNWTDVPERQRSLRATYDYSWRFLPEKEQRSLAGLSVFKGSFTRQASEHVAQTSVTDLRALSEKSFLVHDVAGRYEMHEMLRQYASEKLAGFPDVAEQIYERHARYYSSLSMKWQAAINSSRKQEILGQMMPEAGNLKSARKWMLLHSEPAELSSSLVRMRAYHRSGSFYREGMNNLQEAEQVLESKTQTSEVLSIRGELHAWLAEYAHLLGHPAEIPTHLSLARDFLERAATNGMDVRRGLTLVWFVQGLSESALEAQREAFTQSLTIARDMGDAEFIAQILLHLGAALSSMGEYEESLHDLTESLEYYRERGDPDGIARALTFISYNQLWRGQYELSYQTMLSVVEIIGKGENLEQAGEAYRSLGLMLSWNGRFTESAEVLEQSLPLLRSPANLPGLVYAITILGFVRMHLGDYPSAKASLTEALVLARRSGYWRQYASALLGLGLIELAAGDHQRAQIYCEQSISRFREIQYLSEVGWALGGLSLAQRALGQMHPAWMSLKEGLQITIQAQSMSPMLNCYLPASLLLADLGKMEAALEIYASAETLPGIKNSRWIEQVCGQKIGAAASALPPELAAAIRQRGETLDPLAAAAKALEALEEAFEHPGNKSP